MATHPGAMPILLVLGVLAHSALGAENSSPADSEFFEKEVRPLLAEHCWKCHGDSQPKSGLKLTWDPLESTCRHASLSIL